MKNIIRSWLFAAGMTVFSSFALWNCNIGDPNEVYILEVKVSDTLSVDNGFDSIRVDLYDGNGNLVQDTLFRGPYRAADATRLANLKLDAKPPEPFEVRITAYKDSNEYYIFKTLVTNKVPVTKPSEHIRPDVPGDTNKTPSSLDIVNPTSGTLNVGDPAVTLAAVIDPPTAPQAVTWTVSDTTFAGLQSGNTLVARAPGVVVLKGASAGTPTVWDTLVLTIKSAPTSAPASVKLTVANPLTLEAGGAAVSLTAEVLPADASQSITWTLPATDIVVLESGNRLRGLKPGAVQVKATSAIAPTVSAYLEVTVNEAPKPQPDQISLGMPTPMTLAPDGVESDLTWSVQPLGADQGVDWTSSNILVAQVTPDNKVKSFAIGTATITGKSRAKPAVTVSFQVNVVRPVKADGITVTPGKLTLYTGGPKGKLAVAIIGSDTGARYTLASSDMNIARVAADGSVEALAAGPAVVTASVVGYPAITGACTVTVVKDDPVVTASPNQNVAFNGEATFRVSVAPQAYGSTVEIRADMDGDTVFEQSVLNKDTAEFTHRYTEVKPVTVSFRVRDTEGNVVTVTRKVTVGAPGTPVVAIVNPSKDTTVNVTTLRIRFTVKDTAAKLDATVDSTVILAAGPNVVRASRRNAGGEGSDEVNILVDNTNPTVAIPGAATQSTNTAAFTLSGTAGDAGAGLASVSVSGALSGNGAAVLTADSWSKGGLTLREGDNTLVATATDRAGNTATASIRVTLDTRKPGVPVFSVNIPGAVRTGPIRWAWTKANNDGNARFKVRLTGGTHTGQEIDVGTDTEFSLTTLTDNTTYGLSVKETDSVAGDGAYSAERRVFYDTRAPDPGISRNAATTNVPRWDFTSNGGSGAFRWHYYGNAPGSAGSGALFFAPTNLSTGTYNLCVQERETPEWGDVWGVEKCLAIAVDKTGPLITNVVPKGGALNSGDRVTINYRADNVPKSFECDLTVGGNTDGDKTCSTTERDSLDNPSTVSTVVTRNRNIVFVNLAAPTGGKGTNWDDAISQLNVAITSPGNVGKSVWVAASATAYSFPGDWWTMEPGINVYGGFNASEYPSRLTQRNTTLNRTTLRGAGLSTPMEGNGNIIDGFHFSGMDINLMTNATLANCVITGQRSTNGYGLVLIQGSNVLLDNVIINDNTVDNYAVYVAAVGTVTIRGGEINNNKVGHGSFDRNLYAVYLNYGNLVFESGLDVLGNTQNGANVGQVMTYEGKLTVRSGVSITGGDQGIVLTFNSETGQYMGCLDYMGTESGKCD